MLDSKKSSRDFNTQTQFEKVNKLQRTSQQDESVLMKASPYKPMGSSYQSQSKPVSKVCAKVYGNATSQTDTEQVKMSFPLGHKMEWLKQPGNIQKSPLFEMDEEENDFVKEAEEFLRLDSIVHSDDSNRKRGRNSEIDGNNKVRVEKNEGYLSDFVSELGSDELLYVERMCRERYRSFCREIMKKGRDVFVNHIFYWLSQEAEFLFMSQLRLVCSEWNQMLREITFMRIDYGYYDCSVFKKYRLDKNFPSIQSIRAYCAVLTKFAEPCKRMKSLEVRPYIFRQIPREGFDDYSLEGWNSLTSLRLFNVRGRIKGIERLTSLTELQCTALVFTKSVDLMNLVNLISLKIKDFPDHISFDYDYLTKLTKLSHLESDYPGHFISFSGTGILDTIRSPYHIFDRPGSFNDKHFNHFVENAHFLLLEGRWDKGIFSGRCFIKILNKQSCKIESYKGIMSEGKLITKK